MKYGQISHWIQTVLGVWDPVKLCYLILSQGGGVLFTASTISFPGEFILLGRHRKGVGKGKGKEIKPCPMVGWMTPWTLCVVIANNYRRHWRGYSASTDKRLQLQTSSYNVHNAHIITTYYTGLINVKADQDASKKYPAKLLAIYLAIAKMLTETVCIYYLFIITKWCQTTLPVTTVKLLDFFGTSLTTQ